MPSVYSVLKKSAPYCDKHKGIQALYYNVEEMKFLCSSCVEEGQATTVIEQKVEGKRQNGMQDISKNNKSTFPLQQIIQNPVLLMLKLQASSSLSKIDPPHSPTNCSISQFRRILTQIDYFIKTKKHTQQYTQQFFKKMKDEINSRIDSVLAVVQDNQRMISQLQQKTIQLKGIKKAYSTQFLQTLQTSFINNTQEQLKELLRKYAVENQNPFRKIDQIINEITERVGGFVEVNWEHVMGMERRLLDGYIWRRERVFLVEGGQGEIENGLQRQLYSLQQGDMILPYSTAHKLQFHNPIYIINQQPISQINHHPLFSLALYIRCTRQSIQLLTKQQQLIEKSSSSIYHHNNNSEDSLSLAYSDNNNNNYNYNNKDRQQLRNYEDQMKEGFVVVDMYSGGQDRREGINSSSSDVMRIDLLYELPQKRLLTVCYQGLTVYSYQMGKLTKLTSIPTIKGTNQVLIFEHHCLVLTTTNGLYQINYHQLNRPVKLGVTKLKQNQTVQSMCYLYKDRRKLQNQVLLTVRNNTNNQQYKRQLRMSLDSCDDDDDN